MRRRVLLLLGALALIAAGVTGLAGRAALGAADDLERAQERLRAVQEPGSSTAEVLAALREADEDADDAARVLASWPVDVLAAVPVLGRSWDAERAVTRTARAVIAGAEVLADRLPAVRASAGGVDLSAVAAVRAELAGPARRGRAALGDLESQPLGLTPSRVSRGVADATAAMGPAVRALDDAEQGLQVMTGLLGGAGPRSLLVMLQNNAELRGAGGYAASFATGRLVDGRVDLGPLRDVLSVADPPARARAVPAPEEYVEDYGRLSGNTTLWRSWNMSPHVPDSALVGARVAGVLLPDEPDVVVLLDVPALGALASLGGTGVALPDGSTVTPDELTDALLVDAYAEAGADGRAQVERRAQLQAAATAAVTRLLAGEVPASEAAQTLGRLAAERHLAVWSARPKEQSVLSDLGLAGEVEPSPGGDLSHVSVNNVGANKLDYYVDRDLEIDVTVGADVARVVQRVRFRNEAPSGLVPYVAGRDSPGLVISRVELSLPPAAAELVATVDGKPWRGPRHEGPRRDRLITRLEVPRGETSVLEVAYVLPLTDGRYSARLVPQPLVEDADLRLRIRPGAGESIADVDGVVLADGAVDIRAPLSRTQDLAVDLQGTTSTRWERIKSWWNAPVRSG